MRQFIIINEEILCFQFYAGEPVLESNIHVMSCTCGNGVPRGERALNSFCPFYSTEEFTWKIRASSVPKSLVFPGIDIFNYSQTLCYFNYFNELLVRT